MRLLLDTHIALWLWAEPGRLSHRCADALRSANNSIWLSAASAYEIAFKVNLGKLLPLPADFETLALQSGFSLLEINHTHCEIAGDLPLINRDPWDRLIAAQAMIEEMTLISADAAIRGFGVPVLW
ncbi:MAG: type II toxin-antitoxin system VapC family toxin [Hyphomonadaceae bacterium]|nr:type II toxin-antitoxin system VapC family toxin [Hyphomonadaceae bacterium]